MHITVLNYTVVCAISRLQANITSFSHIFFLFTVVECDWTGTGDAATWACCDLENQCGFGEGDCDSNYQCEGNLECGIDNCQAMNSTKAFSINADCCYDPSKHFVSF